MEWFQGLNEIIGSFNNLFWVPPFIRHSIEDWEIKILREEVSTFDVSASN